MTDYGSLWCFEIAIGCSKLVGRFVFLFGKIVYREYYRQVMADDLEELLNMFNNKRVTREARRETFENIIVKSETKT